MVFGIRDTDNLITGVHPTGKDMDMFIRGIDSIYHNRIITTVSEPTKSIAVGAVSSAIVPATSGTKHLLVITVIPTPGMVYTTGGVKWHRLGASNFSEPTCKIESLSYQLATLQAEHDQLKEYAIRYQVERDTVKGTLKKLTAEYATLMTASKSIATRMDSAEKEVSELHKTLIVTKTENAALEDVIKTHATGAEKEVLELRTEKVIQEDVIKTLTTRATDAEKEVSELQTFLYAEILRQKTIAEEKLASSQTGSILSYLMCF